MFAIPLVGSAALRKRLPWWLKWTLDRWLSASTLFSLLISAYPFVDVVKPARPTRSRSLAPR